MANLSNINGKFVVEQTTGYVGVGTTDPNYPIEVLNASAEIALNASGGSIYRVQSDSASNFIIRKAGVGDRLIINSAGATTFSSSIDAGGRIKVSGGNTDQYYFEGARNGVGVTYRLYDNANNIYHDSWSSQVIRLNQNGGSGGNLIISGGNVGIGTTSPYAQLHVSHSLGNGGIMLGNTATTGSKEMLLNIHPLGLIWQRWVNGAYQANLMTLDYDGNLGIGTTSPLGKLHVSTGTDTSVGNIEFFIGGTNASNARSGKIIKNTSSPYEMTIRASNYTNGNNLILNDTGGNVGIGTNSPGRKLTVTGDASGDANNLLLSNENDTNGDSASIGFSMLSNNTYVKSGIFFERTTTQGRGSLHLAVNNEVNGNNVTKSDAKLTINNVGNVGIGTTSPTVNKLQVEGSTDGLGIAIKNTGTGGRTYGIQSTGGTSGYGQGKLAFVDEAVGARMVITGGTGAGEGSTMINYTNSNIETYGSGAYSGKLIVKAHTTTPNAAITCLNGNVGGDNPVFINFVNEFVANQYNYLARIAAAPENIWTGTASTRNASLNFYTNSAGTSAERMRITSAGGISFGSSGTAYGTSGQVLTSNGNATPTWQAAGGSAWPQEKFAEYTIDSTTSNILVATLNSTTWHGNYLAGCLKFTFSTSNYIQVTYLPVSTFLSAGNKLFFKGTEMTTKNNGSNPATITITFAGNNGTYGSTCTVKLNRNQSEPSYTKVNVLIQAISNPNMFILN